MTTTLPKAVIGSQLASHSARLHLLRLASQALPTGAFAYSGGLESMYDLGYLATEDQCLGYLTSLMRSTVVHLELPIFVLMRSALSDGNNKAAQRHSEYLLASRESFELQEQERQMGRALHRVLLDLHPAECEDWKPTTFCEALARATLLYGIEDEDASTLLVYTWLEQQVSALTRLLPLGPIAGQRLMHGVLEQAPEVIARGRAVTEEDIGASAPLLALASALHETQYTRIFRS